MVPFDEVDEEHAYLEGEGDRSLEYWREVHERFFTEHATHDRGFATDMPVVSSGSGSLTSRSRSWWSQLAAKDSSQPPSW